MKFVGHRFGFGSLPLKADTGGDGKPTLDLEWNGQYQLVFANKDNGYDIFFKTILRIAMVFFAILCWLHLFLYQLRGWLVFRAKCIRVCGVCNLDRNGCACDGG